ncbi:uncharacterized protein LOC123523963 isoform X2 [Mercenaria mercenaria]|uniref:uncharacterized protein LOC123523963 isoform X2 n=1 Tax=Mercenaria mercenaria TaxID=6596 RepID=UPI00234EEA47|nr:uncharacterized protein LOC123523963 isoform X2 [Mercenaria mercenaria]
MLGKFSVPVYALAVLAVMFARFDEDFGCETYGGARWKFRECLYERDVQDFKRMFKNFLRTSDGVIDGDEVYSELTEICSNREIKEGITHCVERIVTDCPALEEIINSTIENKISFFCENNRPSSMLSAALQHGYMFNSNCSNERRIPGLKAIMICSLEASSNISGDIRNFTLGGGLSAYEQFGHQWFLCTLAKIRDEFPNELECGSTVRDVFQTVSIFFISGNDYLAPTLRASDLAVFENV